MYIIWEQCIDFSTNKIHFPNDIKVFINELLDPSSKEGYYKEAKETLQNIFYILDSN